MTMGAGPGFWVSRLRRWAAAIVSAAFAAYCQVLFADAIGSGVFLMLALAAASREGFYFSLIGAGCAAVLAVARGPCGGQARKGLLGYNSVLIGIFWGWYVQPSALGMAVFVVLALLVARLQILVESRFSARGRALPPLTSLPAVIVFLGALAVARVPAVKTALWLSDRFFLPSALSLNPLVAINFNMPLPPPVSWASGTMPVWILLLAGALSQSPRTFGFAVAGTLLGVGIAACPPFFSGLSGKGLFVGFNALPLALALERGVFAPARLGATLLLPALGLCALIWAALDSLLAPLVLPVATFPFALTGLLIWAWQQRLGDRPRRLATIGPVAPSAAVAVDNAPGLTAGGDALVRFGDLVRSANRIAIVSGAGTSTESGIPDIRGNGVFWGQFRPALFDLSAVATRADLRPGYWEMDARFFRLIAAAAPNGVHRFAAGLAAAGKLECVVTQNVDGLFQRTGLGPDKTIEIHGSAWHLRCMGCAAVGHRHVLYPAAGRAEPPPPCPRCGGHLRPDTVFMGEPVDPGLLSTALYRVCTCDLLLVVGTTLLVEPVASLPRIAVSKGVCLVVVNLTPTPVDDLATLVVRDRAGRFLDAAAPPSEG